MRAAVDAALAVAREGLGQIPPVVPPPGIRRYLGFTKLSAAAVRAIARVLDRDDDFRTRVAAAIDEEAIGRAAWLWLARPEGWREEFARHQQEAAATAASAHDEREERDARRRLTAARAATERAIAKASAHEQEAAGIRAELAEAQSHRRRLEQELSLVQAQLDQARDERAAAVRQLKQVEASLARRTLEAKAATARLRDLEQAGPTGLRAVNPVTPPPDLTAMAQALETASARAAGLAAALRELTEQVHATQGPAPAAPEPVADAPAAPEPVAERGDPAAGDLAGLTAAGPRPTRRSALALPPGIRDDSTEAVDHLLRAPGAWLLVDGYNVSMLGWPDAPVSEQRRRLVVALGELAARSGASAKVVFDGTATESSPLPRSARRLVSVMFSPAGVEADDVLLDLVAQLPVNRPVVVASSDKRVRDGARSQGANLVHARQLLAALRR